MLEITDHRKGHDRRTLPRPNATLSVQAVLRHSSLEGGAQNHDRNHGWRVCFSYSLNEYHFNVNSW